MFEPYKTNAMINSIGKNRKVFIVKYEAADNVKAIFDNKLCSAIHNTYNGLFYVDDVYGVIDTLEVIPDGK